MIEGSNDGQHYYTLHNHRGDKLEMAQPTLESIQETCRFVRPFCDTAEHGGVTVTMLIRPPVARSV